MITHDRFPGLASVLDTKLRKIGRFLKVAYGKTDAITKTHAYDKVTKYDVKTEQMIIGQLKRLTPHTPVVGEERGGDTSKKEYWLLDPIDGTIHFIRGNPFSMIMLALIQNNKPVFAVLYNFITDEFFHAYKGGGAYLNHKPIHVSTRTNDESVLLTEIDLRHLGNDTLFMHLSKRYKLMNLICAGYEFAMVAQGHAECRLMIDPFGKSYDFAPGALLVQEAGGIAKNLHGEDYTVNDSHFIAASSETIYNLVTKIISTTRKDLL